MKHMRLCCQVSVNHRNIRGCTITLEVERHILGLVIMLFKLLQDGLSEQVLSKDYSKYSARTLYQIILESKAVRYMRA
ncbi:hypothetical protein KC19_2G055700 [Ceratodon purpureus]|uniref:Uncharacterized protein n=1 Tax=Ceratodon purpureus TaxID=3225 RepID=A0A8T0IUF6_CERPU|nr:hypothetical protein KC19_2G055700 [Ceratodon purpureus]